MSSKIVRKIRDENTGEVVAIETNLRNRSILHRPMLNKGLAFTQQEREELDLIGLLPEKIESLPEQAARTYRQLKSKNTPIEKYVFLNRLHDLNLTLFYYLVQENIDEIMPLIYTPTVGEAVQNFSKIFRKQHGLFIAINQQKHIDQMLSRYPSDSIDFIIVTDGEGVLGLGDQGIGGMDISVGKLMVYIACCGIDPSRVLPIQLDVGTNNQELLNDPSYLGLRAPRATGRAYDEFIDKFVQSVRKQFPHIYLHWEDFGRENARKILNRYRDEMCTFNDDMQGTGIVAAANVRAGVTAYGGKIEDQKIVMFGAGTAGCGIADQLADLIYATGMTLEEARKHIYLVDRFGLVTEHTDAKNIPFFQEPYIKSAAEVADWDVKDRKHISLEEVVRNLRPSVLIGVSTVKNAFTEAIVREMAKHHEHPIIMPLSNPTSLAEAHPRDVIEWSDGRAVVAAGSPFAPVEYKGKIYRISQGNNAFIFPGLGLGAIAVKANRMTDGMIREACRVLSEFSPLMKEPGAPVLPPLTDVQLVSRAVAIAVAKQAVAEGVSEVEDTSDIEKLINLVQWKPEYKRIRAI